MAQAPLIATGTDPDVGTVGDTIWSLKGPLKTGEGI